MSLHHLWQIAFWVVAWCLASVGCGAVWAFVNWGLNKIDPIETESTTTVDPERLRRLMAGSSNVVPMRGRRRVS